MVRDEGERRKGSTMVDAKQERQARRQHGIHGRRFAVWALVLAILSAVIFGPYGVVSWIAGLTGLIFLRVLFVWWAFIGWIALFAAACRGVVRGLRDRRKTSAGLWLGAALGIVLAYALFMMDKTPSSDAMFARGLVTHLEVLTDVDAIQTWIGSVDPNDCLPVPHVNSRGRRLSREEQPEVLRRQWGHVQLELDAQGRPSVRLEWFQSKAGTFGLVIGDRAMTTPASEPGMYGEKRTAIRPGIYFWYEEG